ncbi:hypothetical protein D3C78_1201050 [compost metagenome]
MGSGGAARDHGRSRGFDRIHLEVGEFGLEHARHARDVAAGAHAGDQHIEAVGEVGQDFLGRGAFVHFHVGGVLELLGNPGAGRLRGQFLGAGDRALHALFLGREVKARAIGQHQAPALDGHAVGHDQHQLVALDGGDQGQAHAGVAAGRLDDGAAGLQAAGLFRVLDHGQRDAVLDGAARVAAFGLDPHLGVRAKQAVHAHVRGVSYGLQNVVGFHGVSLGKAGGSRYFGAVDLPSGHILMPCRQGTGAGHCAWVIIRSVKFARPSLVLVSKGRTGGTSGLHRAA